MPESSHNQDSYKSKDEKFKLQIYIVTVIWKMFWKTLHIVNTFAFLFKNDQVHFFFNLILLFDTNTLCG